MGERWFTYSYSELTTRGGGPISATVSIFYAVNRCSLGPHSYSMADYNGLFRAAGGLTCILQQIFLNIVIVHRFNYIYSSN